MPAWLLTTGCNLAAACIWNFSQTMCREAKRYKQAFVWNWRVPSCLPQSSLRFPWVTLCVRECSQSVRQCVFVRVYVCLCERECVGVFRRCCFPQPRSNSVVTQSPCERFPASVLPPVDSLSLAGWVCLTEVCPSPPPHPVLHALPSGLIYYVNRRGSRQ